MTRLTRRKVLLLPAALLPAFRAGAQATPPPAPSPAAVAMSGIVDPLPAVARVVFVRLGFKPDGEISPRQMPGMIFLLVTDGEITVTTDTSISLGPSGAFATPGSAQPPGDGLIRRGEGTAIPPGTTLAFRNRSGVEAQALLLQVTQAGEGADAGATATAVPTSNGVEVDILGTVEAELTSPRAILVVERDVQQPGKAFVTSTGVSGAEVGMIQSGSASVLVQRGNNRIRTAGNANVETSVEPGQRAWLAAGDRYTGVDSSLVWRAGADEDLMVLRAQVISIPQPLR